MPRRTPATDQAAAAQRIEPDAEGQELSPPCGGNWLREADGGLRPRDAGTAAAAGLHWPDATPGADPTTAAG